MLRFDVNISILLRELPFLDRFDEAARLGFAAVEMWWPAGEDPGAVARRARDAGVEVVLLNFPAGDMPAGDRGLLCDRARDAELREGVPRGLELASALECTRMNALVGNVPRGEDRDEHFARARDNLAWVADRAAEAGVTVLVEALNAWENPRYALTSTAATLDFIDSVGRANVAYQYDVYHMQRMEGNVVDTLRRHVGRIGHIQVADSPARHEPGTGELSYGFIFSALEETGYDRWIGLEYNPSGDSAESFRWLPENHGHGVSASDLELPR